MCLSAYQYILPLYEHTWLSTLVLSHPKISFEPNVQEETSSTLVVAYRNAVTDVEICHDVNSSVGYGDVRFLTTSPLF